MAGLAAAFAGVAGVVGLGYRQPEFDAFGISLSERAPRFNERITLMRRLWTEERVSHEGRLARPRRGHRPRVSRRAGPRRARLPQHWLASRVRAHVFLCMLACHVEWHMRKRLKPMLFDDDPAGAARERASIVAPAQSSSAALRKHSRKLNRQWRPGSQLPQPAARSRHLHRQRSHHHSQPSLQLHSGCYPNPNPGPSLHPAECRSD
ncbi:MAG: LLM class flavin-dependent oxidoreductase [Alphaproteobacteria bacterium]|nr:LLM class flavin-dependent oxidoreductase [Alphaproteobacteria bacterium]